MLRYFGLQLAVFAMLLQISVWLQPFLPEDFQVAPLCATLTPIFAADTQHAAHAHNIHHPDVEQPKLEHKPTSKHPHSTDACQFCLSYANVVPLMDATPHPRLIRIQIRLIAIAQSARQIYFQQLRLFLLPQGRAPPSMLLF